MSTLKVGDKLVAVANLLMDDKDIITEGRKYVVVYVFDTGFEVKDNTGKRIQIENRWVGFNAVEKSILFETLSKNRVNKIKSIL